MGWLGLGKALYLGEYQWSSGDLRDEEADCRLPEDTIFPLPSRTDFHRFHPKDIKVTESPQATQGRLPNVNVNITSGA